MRFLTQAMVTQEYNDCAAFCTNILLPWTDQKNAATYLE
jgi:hypothetical protein